MTAEDLTNRLRAEMAAYEGAEPFEVLVAFLAAQLDPENCRGMKPQNMKAETAHPGPKQDACVRATIYMVALCSIIEGEYAEWISNRLPTGKA